AGSARSTVAGPALTRASRATVSATAAAAGSRQRRQLLGRLPGDFRIVASAHADPTALAVDLDDANGDLVALAEHLLDRVDPVARRDVRDVQQAVGALGELDERAERRRLDDLAEVLVADLDLFHHRANALDERVGQLAVGGVDQDLTVVVDVDLGLELLAQATDRLAALADQHPDLAGVDLDLLDPRRKDAERLARRLDDLGHLGKDELARLVGLRQRVP